APGGNLGEGRVPGPHTQEPQASGMADLCAEGISRSSCQPTPFCHVGSDLERSTRSVARDMRSATMFLPTDLSFYACLPPRQATAQWYLDVLRSLWEHGIAYNSGYTWEQTLASADCSFSFLETIGPTKGTLSMFMDQLLTLEPDDAGFLTADAEYMPLKIGIGTEQSTVLDDCVYVAIERFRLWLRLPPEQVGAQRIPYTHVFRTVVDVSASLCEATKPLFGFGYDSGGVQDRGGSIDLDEIARDVLAGRLPDVSQWLDPAPFEYIEPSFLSNEHLLPLLAMPHVQVQRLATGGILVAAPYSPYTFEDSNAVLH